MMMMKWMMCMVVMGVTSSAAAAMVDSTTTSSTRLLQDGTSTNEIIKVPLGLSETKLSKVVLPKPMSDFSTVYDTSNNFIYITGGCDSPKGNEYNEEFGNFVCKNISNNHYKILTYDLSNSTKASSGDVTFTPLADMPTARYRHTAVLLQSYQQILIIGGRNVIDDSIIPTVDIYHIETDTWTTHNVTDPKYLLSDNTGLEYMNRAYVFGGWNGTYTAQGTSFYIEVENGDENDVAPSITFTDIADLPTPRGDTSSVFYTSPTTDDTANTLEMYALVTGGYTHESFCSALDDVEQYNFETDTWKSETFDKLNLARGDKVLVRTSYTTVIESEQQTNYTQHLIYALGGERPIENICDTFEQNITLDPGSETVPIDDIEYYDVRNNSWTLFPKSDIDVYRFRFSAAVDTSTNIIYTLGGQLALNKSCTCFPTSNEIYMYREIFDGDDNDDDENNNNSPTPAKSPTTSATIRTTEWSTIMIVTTVATVMTFILF